MSEILPGLPDHMVRAFLAAIKADPENDTPRLVFADWLAEHEKEGTTHASKSVADWAEYIRDEIAAERSPRLHPDYWELQRRSRGYYDIPVSPMKTLLPKSLHRRDAINFCRGFPEEVTLSPRKFIACADELAESPAPLCAAQFSQAGPSAPDIFALPFLRQLRRLSFRTASLGNDNVRRIAECDHLVGLRSLDLGGCRVGAHGFHALARSEKLTNLRELNLSGAMLHAPDVAVFASSSAMAGLEKLDVGGEFDSSILAPIVISSGMENLRSLHAWPLQGDAEWLRPVIEGALPHLTELNLQARDPGPAISDLLLSERLGGLTCFRISVSHVPVETWGVVRENTGNAKLQFEYRGHRTPREELPALVRSPIVSHCVSLELILVRFLEDEIVALAKSPYCRNLRMLNIYPVHDHGAALNDESVSQLSASQHLAGLIELQLWNNEMTDAGLDALVRATFADSLRRLHLNSGQFTEARLLRLAEPTQFPNLVSLSLGYPHNQGRVAEALRERFG